MDTSNRVQTRCVSDYSSISTAAKARKTTSWPVICRQSKHYASDDDDDQSSDYETVFALNNNFQTFSKTKSQSSYHHRTSTNVIATTGHDTEPLNDNLSNRKYLVADYNNLKQTQLDFHATSSVVNAQSDFSTAGKPNCTTRLLGRNSIVPLMASQSTQAQRRHTILMDTPIQNQSINQRNNMPCTTPPPVIFLFVTLLFTVSATGFLSFAMMSDHWEIIKWDRNLLEHLANRSIQKTSLHWHLDDRVARISFTREPNSSGHGKHDNIFLVPMHGGIWTLCIDLTDDDMRQLGGYGFPHASKCISYLAESIELSRHDDYQMTRRSAMRMHNLSISCSFVCLIILGSAALLGAFGICQRQISAILVTGVMYLLAALFALFTLMIVHFKRHQSRPLTGDDFNGAVEGFVAKRGDAQIARHLVSARLFMTAWSLDLGWGGVILCGITYVLWIMLSKIMRYNPLSALLI